MTTPLLRKGHLYLLRNNNTKICLLGFYQGARHSNYIFVVAPSKCAAIPRDKVNNDEIDIAWVGNQSMRTVRPNEGD